MKDFSSIALKKFDLDFAVDPLFKKTSADFDEGGARGLLLNHLGLDQQCKIIFDASDATVACEIEDLDDDQPVLAIDSIEPEKPQAAEDDESESSDDESKSGDDEGLKEDMNEDESLEQPTAMEIDEEQPKSPVAAETKVDEEEPKGSRVEIFRLKGRVLIWFT